MRIQPTYSADGMRAAYVAAGLWGSPQHFGAIECIAAAAPDRRAVVDSYGSFSTPSWTRRSAGPARG